MPIHVQEKVFEPFFQGDMALSKKFQGTGLGLSICAQLAKLMGGSMALKSEEGKGSTFTLRIPLKQIGSRADSTASSQGTGSVRYNSPRNSISDAGDLQSGLRADIGPIDTRSTRSLSTSSRIYEGSIHGKTLHGCPDAKHGWSRGNEVDQTGRLQGPYRRSFSLLGRSQRQRMPRSRDGRLRIQAHPNASIEARPEDLLPSRIPIAHAYTP